MLSCLRSAVFLAMALDALVGADAQPQALLALAPAAVMLAYLRSLAFLAPALAAFVGAYLQRCLREKGSPRLQDHSSVSSNGKVNLHLACFESPEEGSL